MKETGAGRYREILTLTVSDGAYVIGTDILTTVNNAKILQIVDHENAPLNKITEAEFTTRSASSGTPLEWCIISSYSGTPTAQVRTVNFWPTPNAAEDLYLICEILPTELSSTTDIPIWDESLGLHNIIADVAAAKALLSLGDAKYAAYDIRQDAKVREMRLSVANEWMPSNRDPGPGMKRTGRIQQVIDYPKS